jgi:GNAT superfamily N-acetyltransferase
VTLGPAGAGELPAVLDFEGRHFPAWLDFFRQAIAAEGAAPVILARDTGGEILGTALAMDGPAPGHRHTFVWEKLLGARVGGVGTLGVRPDVRGQGIGLALAARVTGALKAHGLATSYIGWTWLVDWYGKLGYRVWKEYRMSWRLMGPDA